MPTENLFLIKSGIRSWSAFFQAEPLICLIFSHMNQTLGDSLNCHPHMWYDERHQYFCCFLLLKLLTMLKERNKETANRDKDFRHINDIKKTRVTFRLNFFNWSLLNLQCRAYLPVPVPRLFVIVSLKLVGKKKRFLPKERNQAKFSKMFYEWYIDKVPLFSVKLLLESRLVKHPLIQNSRKILEPLWRRQWSLLKLFNVFNLM